MSFLEALRGKRGRLKHADTVVTQVDGRRFLEKQGEVLSIEDTRYGFVVDTKPDDVPSKITGNIYLGSQDCCEPSILRNHNITKVLSLGVRAPHIVPGVTYKFVECLDLPETNIVNILTGEHCVIAFIRDAIANDEHVLIHCNAGVSRSSAIVVGFLMLEDELEYSAAYEIVKGARNCIRPNCGFVQQLKAMPINKD